MEKSLQLKVAPAMKRAETGLGRARIDKATIALLGLEFGDVVEIVGKRIAPVKVFPGFQEDEGKGLVRIDGLTRTSAGVGVDENVVVRVCEAVPAEKVSLAPNIPLGKKVAFQEGIEDVFRNGLMNRPLHKGNDVVVPNVALMGNLAPFTVVSTAPQGTVVISPSTQISVKSAPASKQEAFVGVTYDDVGGLDEELKRVREMVELPLKHPELFDRLGITPPKGVLLYGPPGTGKTLIARALARESGASFHPVQGPEIIGRYYGESEERLRAIFKDAEDNAPSIVFLDEIDSIAPPRDSSGGEVERRVVAQLLTLMDGLSERGGVIVIGATNREDSIDPALRRPGRFDREIEIGIPGREGRAEILAVHTRGMPLADDVSIDSLVSVTQGFVGADLAALAREAAMKCVSRHIHELNLDSAIPERVLNRMKIHMADFDAALAEVEPSGMREVLVDVPKVRWSDVGGLEEVKKEIREVFIPKEYERSFEKLGVSPPKGILFYGPPGTGKTLIAKAVANESGANFISVSGPEVASKWLGETEKAIRQIFKRAKQMAPCIIFFDEIDSIAPVRGRASDSGAWERAVNQLLTSMDGVEGLKNVTVMAATNRPDIIDPALLRPGRFDKLIHIGLPDLPSRLSILEVHSSRMPLLNVDLLDIAETTKGYAGADLEALCREAGMCAFRESPKSEFVTGEHFKKALKSVKPSVTQEVADSYRAMGDEMRKRKARDDSSLYR